MEQSSFLHFRLPNRHDNNMTIDQNNISKRTDMDLTGLGCNLRHVFGQNLAKMTVRISINENNRSMYMYILFSVCILHTYKCSQVLL